MNKHLIAIGTAVLLLVIGLSGCEELSNNISGDEDLVEIYDVNITTIWKTGEYYPNIVEHTEQGFYHNISDYNRWSLKYVITGTVKNIAGELINRVDITANTYDMNGNYLCSSFDVFEDGVYHLPNSYTKDFEITIWKEHSSLTCGCEYFSQIDDYKLEVEVSI